MSEVVLWITGGGTALIVCAMLVGFIAWLRFLDDEAERSNKHRCSCCSRN